MGAEEEEGQEEKDEEAEEENEEEEKDERSEKEDERQTVAPHLRVEDIVENLEWELSSEALKVRIYLFFTFQSI